MVTRQISDRQKDMIDYIKTVKFTTKKNLEIRFNASRSTIKRDLVAITRLINIEPIPGNGGGIQFIDDSAYIRNETEVSLARAIKKLKSGEPLMEVENLLIDDYLNSFEGLI